MERRRHQSTVAHAMPAGAGSSPASTHVRPPSRPATHVAGTRAVDLRPSRVPAWWPHAERSRRVHVEAIGWHVQRWRRTACDGGGPARANQALLLHGTGASAHSFRHLAPLLAAQGFEVLVPDLPGHGFTDTPRAFVPSLPAVAAALRDLLGACDFAPRLVVCHSAGAAIALRMALDGAVEPALLVSINGAVLPLREVTGRLRLPLAKLLAANPLVALGFAAWSRLAGGSSLLLDRTGSTIDVPGRRAYAHLLGDGAHVAGALRLMASWDLRPLERDLSARRRHPSIHWPEVVLLVAREDTVLLPEHARHVREVLPDARLVELDGSGHLAHEEAPTAVASTIARAWRRALAAGRQQPRASRSPSTVIEA